PRRASLHPGRENLNLGRSESLLGRHLALTLVADGLNERAVVRITGTDRRPVVAAGQHGLARIEAQARHLLLRTVARQAVLSQNGADVFLEELRLFRSWRGGCTGTRREPPQDRRHQKSSHHAILPPVRPHPTPIMARQ